MGLFLTSTVDSQGGSTREEAIINQEVICYITDALYDEDWQDSISGKIRDLNEGYHHITLGTILRLYRRENNDFVQEKINFLDNRQSKLDELNGKKTHHH